MIGISTAFENFVFKYFNFSGRASRAEFWLVMPLTWGLILGFAILDILEIWDNLTSRITPTLNPLGYSSVILFLFTLIPRFSLTARRFNDSGHSKRRIGLP